MSSLAANRKLFLVLLFNFAMFGITVAIIGAAVPNMIRQFEWSYLSTGMVVSASSVGYFASSFVAGLLIQRFGAKKVILLGLLIQTCGLAFFGVSPNVIVNLVAALLMGLGQGGTEVVTNFCVVRMEMPGQSRLMNLMHAAFPVGAILGPVLIGWLIAVGRSWQEMFRGMSVACLAMAGGFAFLSFGDMDTGKEEPRNARVPGFVHSPLLLFLVLTIFLYVGSEIGLSAWIGEYYVDFFGSSASTGAYMVSVFWVGILAGRLLVSIGYRSYRQAELLLSVCCLSALSLAGALSMGSPFATGLGFLACGLVFAAIYPVVMALTGQHFQSAQSMAIGIVSTAGGVGSFASPFAMAAIANAYGIRTGFRFYIATTLGMVASAAAVLYLVRKGKSPGSPS